MNKELMEALDILEKEKEISKETLFEAIENSLLTACKNHFGKADNVKVEIDRETCDFLCYMEKEVVETRDDVEDGVLQIALEDARELSQKAQVGDILNVEIKSKEFGRIATQNAKNVILQKIREEAWYSAILAGTSASIWARRMPCSPRASRSGGRCLCLRSASRCMCWK